MTGQRRYMSPFSTMAVSFICAAFRWIHIGKKEPAHKWCGPILLDLPSSSIDLDVFTLVKQKANCWKLSKSSLLLMSRFIFFFLVSPSLLVCAARTSFRIGCWFNLTFLRASPSPHERLSFCWGLFAHLQSNMVAGCLPQPTSSLYNPVSSLYCIIVCDAGCGLVSQAQLLRHRTPFTAIHQQHFEFEQVG